VRWRLERLGLAGVTVTDEDADPLAHESQALAGLSEAAVLGRAALGRGAGRGPLRIGADPDAPWVERDDRPRHRAALPVPVPPAARALRDGRIAVALQRRWADGTTHLVFTPDELLERLVPLVPRPRINLLLCHGVLAPNAPWRQAVVVRGGEGSTAAPANAGPCATPVEDLASDKAKPGRARPKYRAWAELMHRAFEADVLACPRCGGRMVVLATIEDPAVIRRILTHLGASMEPGEALPAARASPWTDSPARLSLLQAHRAARKRRQRLGHGAEGQSRDARGDVEG